MGAGNVSVVSATGGFDTFYGGTGTITINAAQSFGYTAVTDVGNRASSGVLTCTGGSAANYITFGSESSVAITAGVGAVNINVDDATGLWADLSKAASR